MPQPTASTRDPFDLPLSRHIWETKYRYPESDRGINDTWSRVAAAVSAPEEAGRDHWRTEFRTLLRDFRFLPGGRILAGAGTGRSVTLFNCFVMGHIKDSLDGIFDALKEGALTMQQGGGIGNDFSTLRPAGTAATSHGAIASGPVSFMRIWDSMCATLLSTGNRRGAMMATLRCDHPDVEAFIDAKRRPGELRNFNLSVLVSDAFMTAVQTDDEWHLVFPADALAGTHGALVRRRWSGSDRENPCRIVRTIRARALWDRLTQAAYDHAEPGVLFIDRINAENNLAYREQITATNPCGEIPLPAYGACNLGSVNLVKFVRSPFSTDAETDWAALDNAVATGVRFLDNVIDVSDFPLTLQADQARGSRRIGLGITGLGDMLILLGLHYDSDAARAFAAKLMQHIRDSAYRTSIELAREKGGFPFLETESYLAGRFAGRLPATLRDAIGRNGIRNSHLLAIAPTGTTSLLANNVSNGLEPVYGFEYMRGVRQTDGEFRRHRVSDYAWRLFQRLSPGSGLSPAFVDALSLAPDAHLEMQAALQPFVDNAISKTINVPTELDLETHRRIFFRAWELGLKGCTTFRPNPVTGDVLSPAPPGGQEAVHCCTIEREPA